MLNDNFYDENFSISPMNDFNFEIKTENKKITHYKLDDSRIWSIKDEKFVLDLPEDAIIGFCPDEQGNSSLEGLIGCLDFYHYPKGELKTDEEYAAEVREERDKLLDESDYLAMPDYPLSEDKKSAILSYRQALRDISKQAGFPRTIQWPTKPEI